MTTKAGEQPTITQADYEAEAAFDRHIVETIGWTKFASMQTAASGADYSRGFKAGYLARTTSLAAQDLVKQWMDEWTATHDDHWGDQIAWATAREIARRIDEARPSPSLAAQASQIHELHHNSDGRVEIKTTAQTMGEALKRLAAAPAQDGLVEALDRMHTKVLEQSDRSHSDDAHDVFSDLYDDLEAMLAAIKGDKS